MDSRLTTTVAVRFGLFFLGLALMLFLPAGTLGYAEAWIYLAVTGALVSLMTVHLLRTDPQLLERRMRLREKEPGQRKIIGVGYLVFVTAFIIPGLDHRFGWSSIPYSIVLPADAGVVLGYLVFARVLRENQYASRVVEVVEGQTVVNTGPYAVVRHPLYSGAAILYLFSPIALGSYWGLIGSALFLGVLVARILNEEMVLRRDLPGYQEYTGKTRYRLIPGIW